MSAEHRANTSGPEPLLRVRQLRKYYSVRKFLWRKRYPIAAVDGIDFDVPRGKTFALVGSSGSGKSTVARCVTRLESPSSGQVWLAGADIARLRSKELRPLRREVQLVFQDPATSLNPRFSAAEVIEEPMKIQGWGERKQERLDRVRALMLEVGLAPEWMERLALNFSGGQKQRLAIARALALEPKLLVLDEALSGLDLSTQAQIANLLLSLQAKHDLTYLLISHDLELVSGMADVVAVMHEGRIVEQGPTREVISMPKHAATQGLVRAAEVMQGNLCAAMGACP